jgi:hypothetical protein
VAKPWMPLHIHSSYDYNHSDSVNLAEKEAERRHAGAETHARLSCNLHIASHLVSGLVEVGKGIRNGEFATHPPNHRKPLPLPRDPKVPVMEISVSVRRQTAAVFVPDAWVASCPSSQ